MRKIILRFDDLSEYSLCNLWQEIEDILVANNVKPIVAIVPENLDVNITRNCELVEQLSRSEFWDRVRKWQSEYGWEIAAHGLNHQLKETSDNILWFSRLSEYADLSFEEKWTSVIRTREIFQSEDVKVRTWVSPAHGFDQSLLKILKTLDFRYISDGFYPTPVLDSTSGLVFVPQQVWKLKTRFPFKVTTVCMHHLNWTKEDLKDFKRFVIAQRKNLISLEQSLTFCKALDVKFKSLNLFCNMLLVMKKKIL